MTTFWLYSVILLLIALLFILVPVLRYRPVIKTADSEIRKQKNIEVNENDLVVTISSSGNSKNITNVLEYCNLAKIKTIGFSGLNNDNKTRLLADFSLYVPKKTYGIVECIHQVFLHLWLDKSMGIYEWEREDVQNMNSKNFRL